MNFEMLIYLYSSDISSVLHEFSKIAGFYPVRTPESCLNILQSNLYSFSGTQDFKLFKVTQYNLIRIKKNCNFIAIVIFFKRTPC